LINITHKVLDCKIFCHPDGLVCSLPESSFFSAVLIAIQVKFMGKFPMLLAFFKPFGVLTQFTADQPGQRTLADFGFPPQVYPLGRLDLDSEGLLLLSDEAGLNNRLLDPEAAHPRTYLAEVEGIATEPALNTLRRGGLDLKGHRTRPCLATRLDPPPELPPRDPPVRFRKSIPTSWIELTLTEGKNRQVRRMTAAVGFPTLRLVRIRIGSLTLGELQPGIWKELDPSQRTLIWTH
jgi:23S rRNA pseudouridine2457 synthase